MFGGRARCGGLLGGGGEVCGRDYARRHKRRARQRRAVRRVGVRARGRGARRLDALVLGGRPVDVNDLGFAAGMVPIVATWRYVLASSSVV